MAFFEEQCFIAQSGVWRMRGAKWDVSQTRGQLAAGICVPLSVKVLAKPREEVWWQQQLGNLEASPRVSWGPWG